MKEQVFKNVKKALQERRNFYVKRGYKTNCKNNARIHVNYDFSKPSTRARKGRQSTFAGFLRPLSTPSFLYPCTIWYSGRASVR